MIELFGRSYQLDKLIFSALFIISIVIIVLNITYRLAFDTRLMNMNMGIGCALFLYSYWTLFEKPRES